MTEVAKVATEVAGTDAGIVTEMEVLGQIGITMVETVHVPTETSQLQVFNVLRIMV